MSSGIKIGSNIASLTAQRRLAEGTASLSASYERLSSGQRINRASDDAAGLAISLALNANAKIYTQAIRNLNDGISEANIAEGALGALRDISHRQLELSEQSANGTYSLAQRRAMNTEVNKLVEEYNRLLASTQFNGQALFSDNPQGVRIQAGNGTDGSLLLNLGQELSQNVGNGTFQVATMYTATSGGHNAVATADFNGDGRSDIATSDFDGFVSVFISNGDGTFQSEAQYAAGSGTFDLATGDFNGDGRVDLATTNWSANTVSILRGNGDGTFRSPLNRATGSSSPFGCTVGDFNGDGFSDLATADGTGSTLSVFIATGTGTVKARVTYSPGFQAFDVTSGDINGDGKLDLLATAGSGNTLSIFIGNGNGTFQAATQVSIASTAWLTPGDANGDGVVDLVSRDGSGRINVVIGKGDGTFQAAKSYVSGLGPASVALSLADINGDGRLDISAVDGNRRMGVLIGDGNGAFATAAIYTTAATNSTGIAVGDFNGDGAADIVTAEYSSGVSVFLATGTRTAKASYLNICTRQGAYDAMAVVNANLQRIQNELGAIGAMTSRFGVALSTIATTRENSVAASSRITDADMGQEAANLTRTQIVQQAAASVLAQANQQPEIALSLLRNA